MSRSHFFDTLVAELVDLELRNKGLKLADLASILGVREDHIRKINSASSDKRYTLNHLYIISEHWQCSIDNFIPNLQNIKRLQRFNDADEKELVNVIEQIKIELIGDEKNE
ncbi:hypothetical protein ACQV2R_08515 [Facklamia sp. P12937]|uniref:hypothetical protein n=1 Tax=Facklamia sp. P12937 TaxID=3421949 RepID=UPI003D1721CA